MGKPVQQGLFLSSLASFPLGMNSDVPPVALPPNQLSFARNCTVRGNFVTHRPPYQDIGLTFPDTVVQSAFEEGYFQGACYYKPDNGAEQIIASISGKFYSITPAGNNANIADISAPTDNPPQGTQSWLWQGECFVTINDGQSTPAIYNGVNTVRANQGDVIATIQSTWTVPPTGTSVTITFTTNFSGPFDVPLYAYSVGGILLGTFEVNSQSSSSGYQVRLTNIDDVPGAVHPTGTELWIRNGWAGTAVTAGDQCMEQNGTFPPVTRQQCWVEVTPPFTGSVGSRLVWPTINREPAGFGALETIVIQLDSPNGRIRLDRDDGPNNLTSVCINAGDGATIMNSQPDVLVAITTNSFIAPTVGGSVDVTVDRLVNLNGQVVEIDGVHYSVSVVPPVSTTSLYLKAINVLNPGDAVLANATLRTIPQLPPGRVGAYGWGRNAICLVDGKSYVMSDIVGSSSGSIAYNFRDSILNVSENNYLAGGGVFRVPSAGQQISAMAFPATLDSSLGQGPLQVLTQDTVFSCNAPVQRAEWQDLTNPIQTQSLVGGGSLGDAIAINGDLWFRSDDGIRSLKLARQDFQVSYSNTPQSVEMNRVLIDDNRNLLNFWHGVVFDNRALMPATPTQSDGGVYHSQIVVLNLDPNSSLRDKQPPVYDGAWDGLNVLKIVAGTFAGIRRTFAITYNTDEAKIELVEILTTRDGNNFDNDNTRIQWSFESPAIFYQPDTRNRELLKLADGEIFVRDLVGDVQFKVEFRPDYLDTWTTWHEWSVTDSPNFQPRMGLGTPPNTGDSATARPNKVGYHFQLRITVLGHCTFMGANLSATVQPVTDYAPPINSAGLTALVP